MSVITKVRCPRCRNLLRIPTDWLDRPVRCKHCDKSFRAAPKPPPAATPRPADEPPPEADDSPFAFDGPGTADATEFELLPVVPGLRARRPRSSGFQWLVLAAALVTAVIVGAGFYFRGMPALTADVENPGRELTAATVKEVPKVVDLPKAAADFPRRFLAVCVHNYLYANPVSARGDRIVMPEVLRRFAREKLRVPPDQVYVLSDAVYGKEARPPVKPIIEQTAERFLATCRRQDRIVLVFVGHAVEIQDQPQLVPLEGELTAKETLIPLKWLYDRLATCPARQKVLVVDLCREDTARGNERPGSGPMGRKLDAMLAQPPAGVQVLTACIAGQSSHEYDYAAVGNNDVRGGAFLSLLTQAPRSGWGLPKPEEPLPIALLADRVKEPLSQLVAARDKAPQTARLTGSEPAEAGEGAAFDPSATPAAKIEIPRPAALVEGGLADRKLVRQIFAEIKLPPIKPPRDGQEAEMDETDRLAEIVPFRADALKGYEPDYGGLSEILSKSQEYPLRAAVIHAVEALDKLARSGGGKLMDEFRGPATDDVKKFITENQKEGPARLELELSTALEELEGVADQRKKEESKRWQAHYDYVLAQVKARKAYVAEYNLMLGKAKRDELPPLDPKLHNGYRLASQEKLQSGKEIKDLAAESRKLLAKLIKDNPGTPWELLAKRERFTALGLAWQPANLGR